MAKYISNWDGIYPNPNENTVNADILGLVNTSNAVSNAIYTVANFTSTSSTFISGVFTDGTVFAETGSGLTSPVQTINLIDLRTTDGWQYDYYGSLHINFNTQTISGGFNHIAILNTLTSQALDIYGNLSATSSVSSITKIAYRFTDGTTISLSGALIYNDLSGAITGNVTSFQLGDNLGHSYTLSNFSISYDVLGAYTDSNTMVAAIMAGNDSIAGTAAADAILGYAGNDTIDGAAGADTLVGGVGNDTYVVDNVGDVVTEQLNEGTDLVKVNIAAAGGTYALTENVENGTLINVIAFNLTGNTLDNVLIGNAAANILNGNGGIDTLIGGAGNDIYIVDNAGVIITELLNAGIDTVQSSITYSLLDTDGAGANGGNVENLTLIGTAAISATGNALNNVIIGNTGNNTLEGNAGNDSLIGGDGSDTLIGGLGNDSLDGGAGADSMNGGDGADTYFVDNVGDIVTEDSALAVGGIDLVKSTAASFTLNANVENLTLVGLAANNIAGTGNTLANTIIGDDGNNLLNGLDGNDTINGGLGDDTILGGLGNDNLSGGAGNDSLDGGLGVDALNGGAGDDIYVVDLTEMGTTYATTKVVLQDSIADTAGIDTLKLRGSFTHDFTYPISNVVLAATLENLDASQVGLNRLDLTGNALNNTIIGSDGGGVLSGLAGNDSLVGGIGDDVLVGGLGADTLKGGAGNDTYDIDNVNDVIDEQGNTDVWDTVVYRVNASTSLASTLTVGSSSNTVNLATTTANLDLTNIENLILVGTGKYNLVGDAQQNQLIGNAANNIIDGGDGNDFLIGGAGLDTLIGGTGDDTYVVDSLAEVSLIVDSDNNNSLQIGYSYTLTNTLFNNIYLDGVGAINATGNDNNNVLFGNSAANILNGGLGADYMDGGDGNDTYVVDNAFDQVIEFNALAAGGIDLVQSSINFDLSDNSNGDLRDYIEKLTLTGTDNINGTGNALANTITGNIGNNVLDGGAGIDALAGGLGDDTYIVDLTATGALQDSVTEALNAGTDRIQLRGTSTNLVATTIALGANVEILDASATGTSKLNLTGNALTNSLTGNAADNILDGGLGVDALAGGAGNDTYLVDNFGDSVTEQFNEGTDLIKISIATAGGFYILGDNIENGTLTNAVIFQLDGNALDNVLTGNAAANGLVGLDGNDTLDGGAGNDSLMGGLGNDTLDGGAGADTLDGGDGDDTYVVDIVTDVINVDSSGIDTVKSSISYSIATRLDLENVTLIGAAVINGTGNAFDNVIIGNDAANILDGGAGADAMNGGKGADTYIVDNAGDTVTESLTIAQLGGVDLVKSSVSFTLGANVDNLTLTDGSLNGGTVAIDGTGNELNNILIGNAGDNLLTGNAGNDTLTANAGNDTLDGGLGNDTMNGGAGNDLYIVDSTLDVVTESLTNALGGGIDTVQSSVTRTLGANFDNLTLTGLANINGTGNTLDNILLGNDGNNLLTGLAGNDNLNGGIGNDTLDGGAGVDLLTGGNGADVFKFNLTTDCLVGLNHDVIQDFNSADLDKIDLSAIDARTNIVGNQAFTFIGNDAVFSHVSGQLIYDSASHSIYADVNGDGIADMQIGLVGVASLSATDFIL